jgi:hypothetical protein
MEFLLKALAQAAQDRGSKPGRQPKDAKNAGWSGDVDENKRGC